MNELASVLWPIEAASGLPGRYYTESSAFDEERQRIFGRGWFCLAFASDIAAPGDLLPVEAMGTALLLVRTADGNIRCFHNVCRHRGVRLLEKPARGMRAVRCPYHGWAYDLDGRLRATPHIGGVGHHQAPGFRKSDRGLIPVRTGVWLDMVFVDLHGGAPGLAEWLAPLQRQWRDFPLAHYRPADAEPIRFRLNANWKLAVENYCEAYHLPWVHSGLNRISSLADHYPIVDTAFSGQGSRHYAVRGELPCAADRTLAEYVALYPNLLLGAHTDHFFAMRIDPAAPDLTVEEARLWCLEEAAADSAYAEARSRLRARWEEVFREDVDIVERMQRGRQSPAFDGGCFSPVMDTPSHAFHRWVAARLGAEEPA
ncbi:MAG: aromatic ring-hydroxylating dioxygenase subunit alpha [Alphaproteobacteria bacterium]|nr:aromatic ring-hydroxylating dioxygenase subunit alpha [Alphaproteobacteria bacterium]